MSQSLFSFGVSSQESAGPISIDFTELNLDKPIEVIPNIPDKFFLHPPVNSNAASTHFKSQQSKKNYDKLSKVQADLELKKLETSCYTCSGELSLELREKLPFIPPESYLKAATKRFYDGNVMGSLSCIPGAMFHINLAEDRPISQLTVPSIPIVPIVPSKSVSLLSRPISSPLLSGSSASNLLIGTTVPVSPTKQNPPLVGSIYSSKLYNSGLTPLERIRYWIYLQQRIGEESLNGVAMLGNFGSNSKGLFVVKAPFDPENPEPYHEWWVGVNLNQLRRMGIPNFVYTYGGISICSPPLIASRDSQSKEVNKNRILTWCNNSKYAAPYLISENIQGGVAFAEYVQKGNFGVFLNGYLQILFALQIAHEKYGFTHFDLHEKNVLCREIPVHTSVQSSTSISTNQSIGVEMFSIPYPYKGETIYLSTDFIAMLIDFGYSHIQVGGEHYGKFGLEKYGVRADRGFPLSDAFRFLASAFAIIVKTQRKELINNILLIIRYFTKEDPWNFLIKMGENGYYLPDFPEYTQQDLTGLIDYILTKFKVPFISRTPIGLRILGCNLPGTESCSGNTLNFSCDPSRKPQQIEALNQIFSIQNQPQVSDTIVFFDHASLLFRTNRLKELEEFKGKFDSKRLLSSSNNILIDNQTYLKNGVEIIRQPLVLFGKATPQNILDLSWTGKYREYIYSLTTLFDVYQRIWTIARSIYYTSLFYNYLEDAENMKKWIIGLRKSFDPFFDERTNLLDKDVKYLDGLFDLNPFLVKDLNKLAEQKTPGLDKVQEQINATSLINWWTYGIKVSLMSLKVPLPDNYLDL